MSLEKEKPPEPSIIARFHLKHKLDKYYPDWCNENIYNHYGHGFNHDYLKRSLPEMIIDYDRQSVYAAFSPIIDAINRGIDPLIGSNILEIGGSTGLLSRYLQDSGANITLLETEEVFVNKARQRGVNNAQVYNGTDLLGSVPYGEKFDAIIANRVFEDIVMSEKQALILLKQIKTLLKPQGCLIIGTQREEAVWHNAIIRGSQLKLTSSEFAIHHNYIRHVFVYQNSF